MIENPHVERLRYVREHQMRWSNLLRDASSEFEHLVARIELKVGLDRLRLLVQPIVDPAANLLCIYLTRVSCALSALVHRRCKSNEVYLQVDEIIQEVDKDGDGEIDYEEFVNMIAPIVSDTNRNKEGIGAFE